MEARGDRSVRPRAPSEVNDHAMTNDASAIFRAENGDLERLSALETLKGLKSRETVSLGDLVSFLESRGLWGQFRKITLRDLRDAFAPEPKPAETNGKSRRVKRRILEDELFDTELVKPKAKAKPETGGMSTDEFAHLVLPFIEGNMDVTLEDIADYTEIDRKALRHHLGVLVKDGRLERLGVGRTAVYSTP